MTEGELPKRVESAAIQRVLTQIRQVAPTPSTVLLLGETGTGKEVMARTIHDLSPRRQRRMIGVSCAAIPTALIESELFGREKGAYTDALSRQIGRFEAAHQSTLFLDEIGELPMAVQVKLLRVLQERVIERLGSAQPVKVDVRIVAATNRNLEDAVRDKTFREDLFYRLNVFPVVVPPLRERVEDIPALAWTFVDEFAQSFGKTIESISEESLRELQRYRWPGNVRELRNVIQRAVILATGPQLVVAAPRLDDRRMPRNAMTLTELEVSHIRAVLTSTNWRVRGSGGAAERLGLKPTTLESRMSRLGIARMKPGGPPRGRVVIDSGLFIGTLRHRRFAPVAHAFTYPLFMALLDIDRLPELMRVSRLTSYNRFNWASFHDRDHLGDPARPLRERLAVDAARHGIDLPDGRIFLLTHLRYLGYGFNPVSFFYCFDAAERLQIVLAEVSNTFGGAHNYWLRPDAGVADAFAPPPPSRSTCPRSCRSMSITRSPSRRRKTGSSRTWKRSKQAWWASTPRSRSNGGPGMRTRSGAPCSGIRR